MRVARGPVVGEPQLGARVAVVQRQRVGAEADAEPGEQHDRELEALAAVHGEHPHRVVVGLGDDRLVDPRALFPLLVEPLHEAAQARAAGVGERVRGVGEEAEPAPVVARAAGSRAPA